MSVEKLGITFLFLNACGAGVIHCKPASARDSRLNCSKFTWTLGKSDPYPPVPPFTLIVCLYILALNVHTYCVLYILLCVVRLKTDLL